MFFSTEKDQQKTTGEDKLQQRTSDKQDLKFTKQFQISQDKHGKKLVVRKKMMRSNKRPITPPKDPNDFIDEDYKNFMKFISINAPEELKMKK